jgi:hypothetical protein
MKRQLVCVAAVVSVGLVSTGTAVAGSDAPAGNRAAIALYARSAAANARYQEISFVGHGARYSVGKGPNDILYALAFAPRGSKPATDRVSVIQRAGRVVEEVDRLSAAGEPPLVLWIEGSDRWFVRVQRPGTCVKKLTGESGAANFATIGEPYVDSSGSTFAALQRVGAEDIVRSTYQDEGAHANEVDAINAASGLWHSSAVVYTGGPYGGPATTSMTSIHYTRLASFIQPPRTRHCR